jgi:hypothetical protein
MTFNEILKAEQLGLISAELTGVSKYSQGLQDAKVKENWTEYDFETCIQLIESRCEKINDIIPIAKIIKAEPTIELFVYAAEQIKSLRNQLQSISGETQSDIKGLSLYNVLGYANIIDLIANGNAIDYDAVCKLTFATVLLKLRKHAIDLKVRKLNEKSLH